MPTYTVSVSLNFIYTVEAKSEKEAYEQAETLADEEIHHNQNTPEYSRDFCEECSE